MIDLETLGVEPDSVIITLGAVKFNPFSDEEPNRGLYLRCDVEEQSENIEKKENNKVTPQPNKRILTYRRRDGGENSKTDRS